MCSLAWPRFFGFVIGGSMPVTIASNWLATAWDQNTGLHAVTPGTSQIEVVALRWLLEVLDLPRDVQVAAGMGVLACAALAAVGAGRTASAAPHRPHPSTPGSS